ncbi:hypothetical protein KPH14_004823 [Odynerus spinipes]|uniref:Uncharacterized protein n=1 Tax=Odynerus spinipes TaxID=1348599 RepID=A0AAD9VQ22_9HYME|nr:hypothetical protein KPH14_004823 [Odynerus spinipes]
MWRHIIWCWKVLKQYLSNCSIHGVKYLVSANTLHIERCFWLLSCALSWWGCALVIRDSIDDYLEYPIDVSAETSYIKWEVPFPSVAICIKFSSDLKNKYNFKQPPSTLEFSASSATKKRNVSAEELLQAYQTLQISCTDFMGNCSWNDVQFNCCDEFKPLHKTGVGYCYAINSRHIKPHRDSNIKFWINRTVEAGNLVIDLIANQNTNSYIPRFITAYVLDNLQLPILITPAERIITMVRKGHVTQVELVLLPIYNERGVQNFPVRLRNCRFSHETDKDSMFDLYSDDSCTMEGFMREMVKYCGCVSFYYPTPAGARTCNLTELHCLSENKKNIMSQASTTLRCYPLCEKNAMYINVNKPLQMDDIDDEVIRMHFMLLSRPRVRYRRYVVHSLVDVVVAVGSALGLFMGASILSFFEIPYWLFYRRDRMA